MKYMYALFLFLGLLANHSIAMHHIIENNNPESVDYTIKIVEAAVEHGRNNFNSASIGAIALVNKNLYKTCCKAEDVYYTVMDQEDKITGWVQLICSKCFKTSCTCCARKYRGILCRKQGDTCNKAFIASPYINKLVTLYNSIQPMSYILNPMPVISIPSFGLPLEQQALWSKPVVTYTGTSNLYFDNNDSLCILDGLPMLKKTYYHSSFYLDSVHECMISHDGICSRREVFFEYNGKEYPFGILVMFPLFYKKFLKSITMNKHNAIRNDTQTLFYGIDFCRKQFLDAQDHIENILDRLFTMLSTHGKYIKYNFDASREIPLENTYIYSRYMNKIDERDKIVDDPIDLVRFALCARLAKNTKLEKNFLYIYDHLDKELICNPGNKYKFIYKYPLGGILASHWADEPAKRVRSDYKKIRKNLTSFAVIEKLVKEMKTCSSMMPIHHNLCIYIRKHNETYHIYPWQYEDHATTDWIQGKEFVLIHCPGTIVKASIDSKFSNSRIGDVDSLCITEERINSDKTKIPIMHVLKANQVISATNSMENSYKNTETPLSIVQKSSIYAHIFTWPRIIKNIISNYSISHVKTYALSIYNTILSPIGICKNYLHKII